MWMMSKHLNVLWATYNNRLGLFHGKLHKGWIFVKMSSNKGLCLVKYTIESNQPLNCSTTFTFHSPKSGNFDENQTPKIRT